MKMPLHFALFVISLVIFCCSASSIAKTGTPAAKRQSIPSKQEVVVSFVAISKYYNEDEGIYWRFPNLCPELSYATKELASEKRNPLGSCAELALHITWLFWWNLNETATKKEHDHWRQELLKPDGLLDKIQPKNVQNFNVCMNTILNFVNWQLDQTQKGKLILDEESEQYLRQIHQKLTDLKGKNVPHEPFNEMKISHEFFQSLEHKFQRNFQFHVELIHKISSAIDEKYQMNVELLKKLAEKLDESEVDRIRVEIIFETMHIREKAREIRKMFERRKEKKFGNGGDNKDLSSPDKAATEEKASSLLKNLCEEVLEKFAAKLADKKVLAKLDYAQKQLAQLFAESTREWCQMMNNFEAQKEMEIYLPTRTPFHFWNMDELSELTLLFQLEIVERELPEIAVEFYRNALRAVGKWEEGKKRPMDEQSSGSASLAKNTVKKEEDEWKVARRLFSDIFSKMAELELNLHVNMDGQISQHQMESLKKQKPKNPDNFFWNEALALSRLVINVYNELELYKKAELLICTTVNTIINNDEPLHFFIVVGDIEYDYTDVGLVRKQFIRIPWQEYQDIYTKIESIAGIEMVEMKEADRVFYELLDSGYWSGQELKQQKGMRDSHAFVYLFICHLFNDKCPEREQWPDAFANYSPLKESSSEYDAFHRDFNKLLRNEPVQKEPNCKREDVEFMFKLETKRDDTKLSLPIILVSYTAGKMWNEAEQKFVQRQGGTFVGQSEAECVEDDGNGVDNKLMADTELTLSTCKTTMKVYVCTEKVNDTVADGKQSVLLRDVIFHSLEGAHWIEEICKIKMFDLSFHANNKNEPDSSMPIINLEEKRCGGAGTDVKSPIESKLYKEVDNFGAMAKYYNDDEGIYWRFSNVSPELSHATKALVASEERPLNNCQELALRVIWLFWWNLNETATKKEQYQWKQRLLKPDGLLSKIQPKYVQNFETCMDDVLRFVDWQLGQTKKGKLTLDEESEQFMRQMETSHRFSKNLLGVKGKSQEFFQSLEQKFKQKFEFHVKLMDKLVLVIGSKKQLKVKLLKKFAKMLRMSMSEDERQHVEIIFEIKYIRGKAEEIQKMLEGRKGRKGGNASDNSKNFSSPSTTIEEKPSSLLKNLCDGLLGNFAAKLVNKEKSAKLNDKQKELAQQFEESAREWCQAMHESEGQTRMENDDLLSSFPLILIWNMDKLPELELLFQLEIVERELPELAVKFYRNAVKVAKWKNEGAEKMVASSSTSARKMFAKSDDVENESKIARKLFKEFLDKMAAIGLNLYVNMDGRISPDKMESLRKQKPKNPDNFFWKEALALSRLVINVYNELELYRRGELRICTVDVNGAPHFFLAVGDIEYHYTKDGLLRRRFMNQWKRGHPKYITTEPFPGGMGMQMVEVEKADKVFYTLLDSGYWSAQGLNTGMRTCRTFVFLFICLLLNHKCPTIWPSMFVDHEPIAKVRVFEDGFYQKLLDATNQAEKEPNCQLRDMDFAFKVVTRRDKKLLPPILIRYTAGNVWDEANQKIVQRRGGTFIDLSEAECLDGVERERRTGLYKQIVDGVELISTCETTMKVFVCTEERNGIATADGGKQQQQQPILLTDLTFYHFIASTDLLMLAEGFNQLEKIEKIEVFDLSFHAPHHNKPDSMPIINLEELLDNASGAGVDVKSPIEESYWGNKPFEF